MLDTSTNDGMQEPAAASTRLTQWQARTQLSDRQWARIEAELPGRVGARAHNGGNARRFVEAVLWVAQSHAYWSDIPADYGHWHTIYIRFGRWCEEGLWPSVIAAMGAQPEAQAALRVLVDRYSASVARRRERRLQRAAAPA